MKAKADTRPDRMSTLKCACTMPRSTRGDICIRWTRAAPSPAATKLHKDRLSDSPHGTFAGRRTAFLSCSISLRDGAGRGVEYLRRNLQMQAHEMAVMRNVRRF